MKIEKINALVKSKYRVARVKTAPEYVYLFRKDRLVAYTHYEGAPYKNIAPAGYSYHLIKNTFIARAWLKYQEDLNTEAA